MKIDYSREVTPIVARNRIACGLAEGMSYLIKEYKGTANFEILQNGNAKSMSGDNPVFPITDLVQDPKWTLY